jgi:hypothetical protein
MSTRQVRSISFARRKTPGVIAGIKNVDVASELIMFHSVLNCFGTWLKVIKTYCTEILAVLCGPLLHETKPIRVCVERGLRQKQKKQQRQAVIKIRVVMFML